MDSGSLALTLGSIVLVISIGYVIYAVINSLRDRKKYFLPPLKKAREKITVIEVIDNRSVLAPIGYSQYNPLIHEPSMKMKAAFWDKPSIDGLLFALDFKATLREIIGDKGKIKLKGLIEHKKGDRESLFYDYPLPDQTIEETRKALSPYFSNKFQGAAQRVDLWPSTTAIHNTLEIIIELTTYPGLSGNQAVDVKKVIKFAKPEFKTWMDGCYKGIQNNMFGNTGIIADVPWEKPQIALNYCGWEALRKLDKVEEIIENRNLKWDKFEKWYRSHIRTGDNWQAFADEDDGEPLVCATHHAASTASRLSEAFKAQLNKFLDYPKIIEFTNACWSPNYENTIGGYSWTPGKTPTVIHTRYALGLVRSAINAKKETATYPMRQNEILRFLDSLWGPAGFSLAANTSPSLYASRASLLIIKYLELFRICNNLKPDADAEYYELRDTLLYKVNTGLNKMLSIYRINGEKEYQVFPVASAVDHYASLVH